MIEENNTITIDAEDTEIEERHLEIEGIEGFFSFAKKALRKASKLARNPLIKSFLPPGTSFGLNMMNKLVNQQKKGKKIHFTPTATKNIYISAFAKGRLFERKKMIKALKQGRL